MASDAGAGSSEAPRKTLDDIRRELEAEFPDPHPGEPDATRARVSMAPYLDDEEEAVERPRFARHRPRRRRGYATAAAVGCIAGQVLLVVIYFAVTWESIWPGALASVPEIVEPRAEPSAAILPPVLAPGVDRRLEEFRTELQALAAELQRSESRVSGMESRVRSVESSVRRLGDDVASAAVTRRAERARPAPRQTAETPVPAAPLRSEPGPVTATDSERWIPSERPAPRSPAPPREVRPIAEAVAPPPPSMPPRPGTEPTQAFETRAPATDAAPRRAASAPQDGTSPSTMPLTLRDRVRDEWRMFKLGLAVVGEDVKTTVRDLARRVRGE